MKDRLMVALDVPDVSSALVVIEQTHQHVGWYKIGLELIASQNADKVLGWVKKHEARAFFDIKLNDIPTTVGRSVRAAKKLGVDLINVHATAGLAAMKAAVEEAGDETMVAAVTILTSLDCNDLEKCRFDISGHMSDASAVGSLVSDLACLAAEAKVPAIICSPRDLPYLVNGGVFDKFVKITPGVRPAWAAANDQKRAMSPADAIEAGADKLVVGRPITAPPDGLTCSQAAQKILAEIEAMEASIKESYVLSSV